MADLSERIEDLAQAVGAECKSIRALVAQKATVVVLTQAQYDALPVKDPAVLYVVTA